MLRRCMIFNKKKFSRFTQVTSHRRWWLLWFIASVLLCCTWFEHCRLGNTIYIASIVTKKGVYWSNRLSINTKTQKICLFKPYHWVDSFNLKQILAEKVLLFRVQTLNATTCARHHFISSIRRTSVLCVNKNTLIFFLKHCLQYAWLKNTILRISCKYCV